MSKREHPRWKLSPIRANRRMAKVFVLILFAWKKCNFSHQLCKNGKHYTDWKNVPNKDKPMLLSHMNKMGLMWLHAETFEKHKQTMPPEYAHLLGNAMGMKPKYKSM